MKYWQLVLLLLFLTGRPLHRGRGLKSLLLHELYLMKQQSPPTQGAWIEIFLGAVIHMPIYGRPLHRGRGLKYEMDYDKTQNNGRPLHRGRGLKYLLRMVVQSFFQSPPTQGAWIEIKVKDWYNAIYSVAPYTGGVD